MHDMSAVVLPVWVWILQIVFMHTLYSTIEVLFWQELWRWSSCTTALFARMVSANTHLATPHAETEKLYCARFLTVTIPTVGEHLQDFKYMQAFPPSVHDNLLLVTLLLIIWNPICVDVESELHLQLIFILQPLGLISQYVIHVQSTRLLVA